MNITEFTEEQIQQGIDQAQEQRDGLNEHIRLLFTPKQINENNFEQVCDIYSRIDPDNYDTVIVVESHDKVLNKKLPMPSNKYFETPLGKVKVNDALRNDFCDEDDDFFVSDEGFSKDMSLFQQLMMLQVVMNDFQVLSVQIADEGSFIVKELAYVLEEVMASRNSLIIFCCDLPVDRKKEYERLKSIIQSEENSDLLHFLNSGDTYIDGVGSFIAGIMVSWEWGLSIHFLDGDYIQKPDNNLLSGYASYTQNSKIILESV